METKKVASKKNNIKEIKRRGNESKTRWGKKETKQVSGKNHRYGKKTKKVTIKATVSLISYDPACKNGNARFTRVSFKLFSE